MKKYLSILTIHSLLVILLCALSCYLSLYFHLKLYMDFLILGIVIVFPITFSMRVAFRRRERALQYLSLFKSSLQSFVYAFGNTKLEDDKKQELKNISSRVSDELVDYLLRNKNEANAVQNAFHDLYVFIRTNKATLKGRFTLRILLFVNRINESIEFLLATRRHTIPWGPKFIVLLAIYMFVIFYPAGLLNRTGFDVPYWYVLAMTASKAFFLITFYNVQGMLENPFDQNSPDGIRVNDFRFSWLPEPVVIIPKKEKPLIDEQKIPAENLLPKEDEESEGEQT